MREHGIAGITWRKRRNQTKPAGAATMPDLIQRDFTAPMPALKLIGDISSFPTGEGWLYLATILDLCDKELVGWAIAPHMRASLTVDAITSAHRAGLVAGNAIVPGRRRRGVLLRHAQSRDRRNQLAEPGQRPDGHRELDHRLQPQAPALINRLPDSNLRSTGLAAAHVNQRIR